jgi:glycine/sarcosine N-methyltransferase
MEDLFGDVAREYDGMFPRDFAEDNRMLSRAFKGHNIRTVLDCACGTGPHVALLAGQGFNVTGTDSSRPMLEEARARLEDQELSADLVHARWQDLPEALGKRFDAVICIGNSLPLAGDDDEVQASIKGMFDVVSPGGVLVIQNRNMDKMKRERPEAILNEADQPGNYTLFIFEYKDPIVIYKIFYIVTGREHDVSYHEFPMNLLVRAKFDRMLQGVGATSWRHYGDSYFSSFSPSRSPRMIAVVDK